MATVYSEEYWTGSYTYTRVRVDYSGTTATAYLLYTRTNTYSGATGGSGTFSFGGSSVYFEQYFYGQQTDAVVASVTFSIPIEGGEYSGSSTEGAFLGGSWSVTIPAQYSAPTGLSVSIAEKYTNGAKFNVSVSSYGNPSGASGRYIEAGILNQNSYGASYRYSTASNVSSAEITVTNSSGGTSGFTISPNTQYYYGGYAYNTQLSTNVVTGTFVTLCEAPTALSLTSQQYIADYLVQANFSYAVPADGGALTKTIQYRYSANAGEVYSPWATAATVSTGSATTGTFSAVLQTDEDILLEIRTTTSSGSSTSISTSFSTLPYHLGPTFTDFDYADINSATVAITGDDQVLIQGNSTLRVTIPVAKRALPTDNVAVDHYTTELEGITFTENWSAQDDVIFSLGQPSVSGTISLPVTAYDVVDSFTTVTKDITILPYSAPTVSPTYVRTGDEGHVDVAIAGTYSPLTYGGSGLNTLTVEYRLSDNEGVITDWTTVQITTSDGEFSGVAGDLPTDYKGIYLVEVRVTDALNSVTEAVTISVFEETRVLQNPQWDIEVWDRTGVFLADITRYLTSDLNITWELNDIEDLSFDVNLDAIEALTPTTGSVVTLLTPYAHDIRVRRNGKYIVGCQIVECNIKIDTEQIPQLSIKATGYLNIFKDQYISLPMAGYTYPEMAHQLIYMAQHSDYLIKNPTGDIDASYWISPVSSIAQTTVAKTGAGAVQCVRSSTATWTGLGSQMKVKAGTQIKVDFWVAAPSGRTVYIRERELINNSATQGTVGSISTSGITTYVHFTGTYTTQFDNGYIYIEFQQTGSSEILRVDNVFISTTDDDDSLCNHYVGTIYTSTTGETGGTGHNYATSGYSDREFNYDLQNVKDAVMDLVEMGEDQFDFEFTYDKNFNTYDQKGDYKPEYEILYPGNVSSMQVTRSASDLANRIQNIGSGIGDERLEVWAKDYDSRVLYGTRESIITNNNVSLEETLQGQADGELIERKDITKEVSVTIQDGSINCGVVETGDILPLKIGNYLGLLTQNTTILNSLEGWYRIKQLNARVSQDGVETLNLTLDFWEEFEDES